jgi:hypothetical protein
VPAEEGDAGQVVALLLQLHGHESLLDENPVWENGPIQDYCRLFQPSTQGPIYDKFEEISQFSARCVQCGVTSKQAGENLVDIIYN